MIFEWKDRTCASKHVPLCSAHCARICVHAQANSRLNKTNSGECGALRTTRFHIKKLPRQSVADRRENETRKVLRYEREFRPIREKRNAFLARSV